MLQVLVLAPHADDGEIGCGAIIARLVEEGKNVVYVAFSTCEKSVPVGLPRDILGVEVKVATKVLGIESENLLIKRYPVRRFPEYRQRILEDLMALEATLKPMLVFTPSSFDVHQDHKVIFEESRRAFRKQSLLGYESVWNNYSFSADCFFPVEERHVEAKVLALSKYKSQAQRKPIQPRVRSLALCRGSQIEQDYAEAFEAIRWIV